MNFTMCYLQFVGVDWFGWQRAVIAELLNDRAQFVTLIYGSRDLIDEEIHAIQLQKTSAKASLFKSKY